MLRKLLFCAGFIFTQLSLADSFYLYITSYQGQTISSYKIKNDGTLEDLHKIYSLGGIPEDLGSYNVVYNKNKYIFLAYSNQNKVAVWRALDNGDLQLQGEYDTSVFPDPISSVIDDRFLYVNSSKGLLIDGFNFNPESGSLTKMPGSPFSISSPTYGYLASINNKYLYEQYVIENKFAAIPINQDGSLGIAKSRVDVGMSPMHYTVFDGYLYVVSTSANGISKFRISETQDEFLPENKYPSLNVDYMFDFMPLRMMRNGNFLYFTDTSNFINIFKIGDDHNLTFIDKINCGGLVGRSLVFNYPGHAYQPVRDSNRINHYNVDPASGKLILKEIYPTPVTPFHIAIIQHHN